jgi:hypothetical protein
MKFVSALQERLEAQDKLSRHLMRNLGFDENELMSKVCSERTMVVVADLETP